MTFIKIKDTYIKFDLISSFKLESKSVIIRWGEERRMFDFESEEEAEQTIKDLIEKDKIETSPNNTKDRHSTKKHSTPPVDSSNEKESEKTLEKKLDNF